MSERRYKSDAEYLDEANEAVRELVTAQANRICRNCRWWDARNAGVFSSHPKNWGECELGSSGDGNRDHKESKVFALDGERYGASLVTAPDFGCVQWEGKE